jgi:hypothetical protein
VTNAGVSVKEVRDYATQTGSLDAVVEYHQMSFNLLLHGEASRVQTGVVSATFFDVLGVTPLLGRTFRDDDDSKNAPAVLVLSYAYWKNALGGDPNVIGRTFEMNDRVHTVIGVLPPIPQFPQASPPDDVFMPPSACPFRSNPQTIENRTARMLTAIGRLKPGMTLERARTDLAVVNNRLGTEYPEAYDTAHTGFTASALSVHDELTRQARPILLVLLATTGFVLLLVAANIANLALARVIGRERELALRGALGAGRGRIARHHHRRGNRRRRLVLRQPADDGDRRPDGARRAAIERGADDRAAGADAGDDRIGIGAGHRVDDDAGRGAPAVRRRADRSDHLCSRDRHARGGGGARVPGAGTASRGDRSDAGAARRLA